MTLDLGDVFATKSTTTFEPDWLKPKLGNIAVSLNMHMWGFAAIARIKEEAIWPHPQDSRHFATILLKGVSVNFAEMQQKRAYLDGRVPRFLAFDILPRQGAPNGSHQLRGG